MHNKSVTADYQATIIDSCNIGDDYFGAPESVPFAERDPATDRVVSDRRTAAA